MSAIVTVFTALPAVMVLMSVIVMILIALLVSGVGSDVSSGHGIHVRNIVSWE